MNYYMVILINLLAVLVFSINPITIPHSNFFTGSYSVNINTNNHTTINMGTYSNFIIPFKTAVDINFNSKALFTIESIDSHTYQNRARIDGLADYVIMNLQINKISLSQSSLRILIYANLFRYYFYLLKIGYIVIINPSTNDQNQFFSVQFITGMVPVYNKIYSNFTFSKYSDRTRVKIVCMLSDVYYKLSQNKLINGNAYLISFQLTSYSFNNSIANIELALKSIFFQPDSQFYFRFTAIIYDKSLIISPLITQTYISLHISPGSSIIQNSSLNLNQQFGNYLFGFRKIYYTNNGQPTFNIQSFIINSNQIKLAANRSTVVQYQMWIYILRTCYQPYNLYNTTSQKCQSCQASQYYNNVNNTCTSCSSICLTCFNSSMCTSCNSTQNRIINNYTCIPKEGYFQNNNDICPICDSNCKACLINSTNCISCKTNQYLNGSTCMNCTNNIVGCSTCYNQTACTICGPSYSLINITYCAHSCSPSLTNCVYCKNTNSSECIECNITHKLLNGSCVLFKCGDGKIDQYEQCDDANLIDGDGCSSMCKQQANYICNSTIVNGINLTRYCKYVVPIVLEKFYIQKMAQSNKIKLRFFSDQLLEYFWVNHIDISRYVFLNISYKFLNATIKYKQTSAQSRKLQQNRSLLGTMDKKYYIQIIFQYLTHIHLKNISFYLSFDSSRDMVINSIPPSVINILINPQNNNIANYYSQQTYKYVQMMFGILIWIGPIYLGLMLVGMLGRVQRIGAQGLFVIQSIYLSLLCCQWLSPTVSSLVSLRSSINPLFNNLSYDDDINISFRFKAIRMKKQLLQNINILLMPLILSLLGGFLLKIINIFKQNKYIALQNRILKEIVFGCLLSIIAPISCLFVIEIKYYSDSYNINILNIVSGFIIIGLLMIYMVLYYKYCDQFGQYYNTLQQKNKQNHSIKRYQSNMYQAYIVILILINIIVAFLFNNQPVFYILIALVLLLWFVLWKRQIFIKSMDQVRILFNLFTLLSAYIILAFNSIFINNIDLENNQFYSNNGLIIGIIIFINLLFNIVFFCYYFIRNISKKRKRLNTSIVKRLDQEQYRTVNSQKIHEIFDNSLQNPINKTIPKYALGFIQYQQSQKQIINNIIGNIQKKYNIIPAQKQFQQSYKKDKKQRHQLRKKQIIHKLQKKQQHHNNFGQKYNKQNNSNKQL